MDGDGLARGQDGLTDISGNIYLNKKCRNCDCELTIHNAAKTYKKKECYRSLCISCRTKQVTKQLTGNPKRHEYMRKYIRRIGKVKEYPCETCSALCYKKYARAFCSDKCRFMAYVNKDDTGCWLWTGSKLNKGYGCFGIKNKKSRIASRTAYELFKGPIEGKLFICHSCDVPSCVNPDHLWAGTHMENMMDMIDKGRQSSRLTPIQVHELRKLKEKGYDRKRLADMFNIAVGTVDGIVRRKRWRHV